MSVVIFPNRIREFRRSLNLTPAQLSMAAGVTVAYVSKIEKGFRRPSAKILEAMAKKLGQKAEALMVTKAAPEKVRQFWADEAQRFDRMMASASQTGAALRYIRIEQKKSLQEIADRTGLNIYTVHVIETGRREVRDSEFLKLAKGLRFRSAEILKARIGKLLKSQELRDFIAENEEVSADKSSLWQHRHMPISEEGLAIYGLAGGNLGEIRIDRRQTPVATLPAFDYKGCYGVSLSAPVLGRAIPGDSIMIVKPGAEIVMGSLALFYDEAQTTARFGILEMSPSGRVELIQEIGDRRAIPIPAEIPDIATRLHPVITILLSPAIKATKISAFAGDPDS